MSVDILLATYNGERYLAEQLDSLLAQTHSECRILARDDGSQDRSFLILRDYANRFPEKITITESSSKNIGVLANFSTLAEAASAPYIMFCDQDDVWHPEKVAKTLQTMRETEATQGVATPLLVHTDARVTDAELRSTAPSFHALEKLAPAHAKLAKLLTQNVVLGCTSMANRALLQLALPIAPEARMHDHWLALVAAACGQIVYIPEVTMDYRQHGRNAVGTTKRKYSGMRVQVRQLIQKNSAQAAALAKKLGNVLPDSSLATLKAFSNLPGLSPLPRRKTIVREGFMRHPWYQNIPWLLFC